MSKLLTALRRCSGCAGRLSGVAFRHIFAIIQYFEEQKDQTGASGLIFDRDLSCDNCYLKVKFSAAI
jgi:hypothetical protein